jgi:hypothetical protein
LIRAVGSAITENISGTFAAALLQSEERLKSKCRHSKAAEAVVT